MCGTTKVLERVLCLEFQSDQDKRNAQGSASDGELYFITTLLYAGNRWGNEVSINYYGEARQILDAMWGKRRTDGCTTCSI
jgi:oligosaccharide reducing-end xylanase